MMSTQKVSNLLDMHGRWNMKILNKYFRPSDIQTIFSIRTSPSEEEDFIAWHPGKFGTFSVKSAYHLAMCEHVQEHNAGASSMRSEGNRPCWNLIWQATVPPKMRSFAWRVAVDALPTNSCKARRHLNVPAHCPLCGADEENSFHALIVCPHARSLWEEMYEEWQLP